MSVRLKIGTYIVDAAETSSTSTTTGVRLLTQRPGFSWSEDLNTATVIVPILITRDTLANYKTSRDALVNALTKTVNANLVFESAAGTTFKDWLIGAGAWQKVECKLEVEDENDSGNDVSALALAVFTVTRAGASTGSAGDPANAVTPVLWSFGLDSNGLGSCTGTCAFESRAAAAAWVVAMRAGTDWPAWLGTQFRFATAIYQKEQQQNQADPVPDAAYTPAQVTVVFNAIPAVFAGDSAFDNVISVEYDAVRSPRAPMDENAGEDTGYDITGVCTLQFKTEADGTYDSNDTSTVAGGALKGAALACLDSIEADAKTRLGVAWFRPTDPVVTVKQGGLVVINFTGMTGDDGRITDWSESLHVVVTPRDRGITGSAGTRIHPHRLGPEIIIQHSLVVTAFSEVRYEPPAFISDAWQPLSPNPARPIVKTHAGEGKREYVMAWSNAWKYLGDASGARGKYNYDEVMGGLS